MTLATSTPHLNIGYFYKDSLNLYGDNGNVEILSHRAKAHGIPTHVHIITTETPSDVLSGLGINLIFMGGGPDSAQKDIYTDLTTVKKAFLHNYISSGGVGLYICGSYQLLGHYYEAADGTRLAGLGVLDFYTKHFGKDKPRCIGNTTATLSPLITTDSAFLENPLSKLFGNVIVGFENHGGRTYLGSGIEPFAQVTKGHGNNSEDLTEGVLYKHTIGSYFHGPILARNPHLADYLLAKATGVQLISELPFDKSLVYQAFTASKKLKQ